MFNACSQGYPRQMNQHAASTEPGGYLFAFSFTRRWLRVAGLGAAASGAVISVLANATEPFRAPLGIALGVLAITVLIAIAVKSSPPGRMPEPARTEARAGHRAVLGNMRGRRSVAAELALLAELHAKGALSDGEFSAAKIRTLGD
jgi:hypothetical protein